MKKGIKVRFHDIQDMLKFNPNVFEFHFSDKDLDCNFSNQNYDQELIVHAPEYWKDKLMNPCGTGIRQHDREQTIKIIQRTIDFTKGLSKHFKGKPRLVLHPGGMSTQPITDEEKLKEMRDNLKDTLSKLDNKGVEILIENMPPFPWFFGGQWCCNIFRNANEIKQLCDETNSKMCFDLSHAKLHCNQTGEDLINFIKTVRPYMAHIHIADAGGVDGEALQIDEGEINFAEVIPLLKDLDLTVIPEIWRGHEHGGKGFDIAFKRLRKYFDEEIEN